MAGEIDKENGVNVLALHEGLKKLRQEKADCSKGLLDSIEGAEEVKKGETQKPVISLEKNALRPKLKRGIKFLSVLRNLQVLGPVAHVLMGELQMNPAILPDWYVTPPGPDSDPAFASRIPAALDKLYELGCIARLTGTGDKVYVISPELWPVLRQDAVQKDFFRQIIQFNRPGDNKFCIENLRILKGLYFIRKNLKDGGRFYSCMEGFGDISGLLHVMGSNEKGPFDLVLFDPELGEITEDEIRNIVKGPDDGKNESGKYEDPSAGLVPVFMISSEVEICKWRPFVQKLGLDRSYFLEIGQEIGSYRLMDKNGKEQPVQVLYNRTDE